jgi:hypothetical protein
MWHTKSKSQIVFFVHAADTNLILGFRHNVDEICALLGYYAASCGNCLPTLQDNVSASSSTITTMSQKSADLRLQILIISILHFSCTHLIFFLFLYCVDNLYILHIQLH